MIKPLCTDMELLKTPSRPAIKKDRHIAKDLTDTMNAHPNCIGMAADMIGENICLLTARGQSEDLIMFNPVILSKKNPYTTKEGCLCHMGEKGTTRYETIQVEYRDKNWKMQKKTFSGLRAQIIQHEMDHMKGILI